LEKIKMSQDNRRHSIVTGHHAEQKFRTPLLTGCFGNPALCFTAWLLPCIPVGKTGNALGDGGWMSQGMFRIWIDVS